MNGIADGDPIHRRQVDGLAYYTFPILEQYPGLVHAVTTRHGGVSRGPFASLNLGRCLGDAHEAVEENVRRTARALGIRREHLVSPRQRHTALARKVDQSNRGKILDGFDILVTNQEDVPLLMVYADCVPVLIYDPEARAIALVHSGWRGTVQGAAGAAVQALTREFGSRPGDLVAAIGPSIGPCCYEVGPEVADAVRGNFDQAESLLRRQETSGSLHLDLWSANRRWLLDAGVRKIETSGVCTACHLEEFYSHRAEAGRTGHFAAVLGLASVQPA